MPLGPILGRELLTLPRKPRGHGARVGVALMMGGALAANYYGYREFYENQGHFTLTQLSIYARSTFFSLAGLQFLLTLTLVPGFVSPAIAEEKDRKTLHYLLASQLGSGEIIVGKLVARMLQYLVAITAGLPIFLILTLLGGFQPEWVFALYVMTLSMAYFLAGMAMFASTISKRTKQASNLAGVFAGAWFMAPIVLWILSLARLIPRPFQPVLNFLNDWLFDVSTTSLFASISAIYYAATGRANVGMMQDRVIRMIGLQLAYGTLFIILSIVLLRPAYRRMDNPPRRLIDRLWGVRTVARKHPRIGGWPILWKECFTSPPSGVGRFLGYFIAFFFLSCLCVGLFRIMAPFVAHWLGFGIMSEPEIDRWLTISNGTVRYVTATVYGFAAFLIAGSAATMISAERERDTWDGLIVTPLDPRAIILQKMFGAIYQQRWLLIPIALVWTCGLVTGGLSPLAAMLVIFELAILLVFASSIGLWSSLLAKGTSKASSWAGGLLLLFNVTGPMAAWAMESDSVWYWTLCSPATVAISLFRHGESYRPPEIGFSDYRTPFWFIGLLGIAFYTFAAGWFTRSAIRRFDAAVGRPRRSLQTMSLARGVQRDDRRRTHFKEDAGSLSDVS